MLLKVVPQVVGTSVSLVAAISIKQWKAPPLAVCSDVPLTQATSTDKNVFDLFLSCHRDGFVWKGETMSVPM